MEENKSNGLFGGLLSSLGKIASSQFKVMGKAVGLAAKGADAIGRGLLGDNIIDKIEKPFKVTGELAHQAVDKFKANTDALEQSADRREAGLNKSSNVMSQGNKQMTQQPGSIDFKNNEATKNVGNMAKGNNIDNIIAAASPASGANGMALAGRVGPSAPNVGLDKG